MTKHMTLCTWNCKQRSMAKVSGQSGEQGTGDEVGEAGKGENKGMMT